MVNPTAWVENGKTRLADIKINGQTLQSAYNYNASCTGKPDTLIFAELKADENGTLHVEVAANEKTNSTVQVSFILVSGTKKTAPKPTASPAPYATPTLTATPAQTNVVRQPLAADSIPQELKDKGYNTPEKVTEKLKQETERVMSAQNTEWYSVELMVSTDNVKT